MNKSFNAILLKETRHILRDKKTLAFTLLIPVILVLIFGYAIRTEIYNAQIAVLDYSKSVHSKSLISKFSNSDYFSVTHFLDSQEEINQTFRQGKVRMVIVIPQEFDYDITIKKHAQIQFITDASDLNIATTLTGYAKQIIFQHVQSLQIPHSFSADIQPVEIRLQMQYNPDMESAYMFIPGNIALIMILITSLMAAIAIASERETGSWKMLVISPAHQLIILLGKILPYMLLSLICTGIVIILGALIFSMPMNGSIALLILVCFLFMLTACSLGVLMAVITNTQQVAMLACMIGFFLPTLLLSGFIFPIENMPIWLRLLSHCVPAKWFIIAMRDIMIKGSGMEIVWLPVTILSCLSIVLIAASGRQLYINERATS